MSRKMASLYYHQIKWQIDEIVVKYDDNEKYNFSDRNNYNISRKFSIVSLWFGYTENLLLANQVEYYNCFDVVFEDNDAILEDIYKDINYYSVLQKYRYNYSDPHFFDKLDSKVKSTVITILEGQWVTDQR